MRYTSRLLLLVVTTAACSSIVSAQDNPAGDAAVVLLPPASQDETEAVQEIETDPTDLPPALREKFDTLEDSPLPPLSNEIDPLLRQNRTSPLVAPSIFGTDRTASIQGDRLEIPALITPTTDVSQIGNQRTPVDIGGNKMNEQIPLPEGMMDRQTDWTLTSYFWQAPNTWSHPLYFQDVMLERHGHERCRALQPLISGAKFFGTFPMLPYLMAVQPACDCDYHLGYYRPGSCAPPLLQRPPYERRAAVIQAGATAGAFLAIP